jgi:hypothetical protein
MHVVYQSYVEGQTWPGAFAQNFPFITSIACAVAGGLTQDDAEARLIKQRPDLYPPRFGTIMATAWARYRAQSRDSEGGLRGSLRSFVLDEMERVSNRMAQQGQQTGQYIMQGFTGVSSAFKTPVGGAAVKPQGNPVTEPLSV